MKKHTHTTGSFLFAFTAGVVFGWGNLSADEVERPEIDSVPKWAQSAIWYQIFVERFRNGDPSNDPRPEDIAGAYPGFVPDGWHVTPWTQDWYEADDWASDVIGKKAFDGSVISSFSQWSRLRRYGGDLQGIVDKLDYLESLGITAIYFNPLNDAPSDHKYDARNWRHIDRNFGPNPDLDAEIMKTENPVDPSTWKLTSADQFFLELVQKLKARGIRVIMDYSWNHTGVQFWAWQDVLEKQANSPYKDWYWVESFDDPQTPESEFRYRGWSGVSDLPEIRKTEFHNSSERIVAYEGNLASNGARNHIFSVARKWLDPNGDGDPSDGIDGFRLDVAAELPLGFWRDFRKVVRSVNPEALLLGEIWWERWPDDLMDPAPYLKGDVFDSVMNYRWYRSARHLFASAPDYLDISEFIEEQSGFLEGMIKETQQALMNLVSSHDTPRVATSLYNGGRYKFYAEPTSNPDYKIDRPDARTFETLRLLLAYQFTYTGAPHIWAGDEMGMWGADMGDSRKPIIWSDYQFSPEKTHPLGVERPVDAVIFNMPHFQYYQKLARIRKNNPILSSGELEYFLKDDESRVFGFRRFEGQDNVYAIFNLSEQEREVVFESKSESVFKELLHDLSVDQSKRGIVHLVIPARCAAIVASVK